MINNQQILNEIKRNAQALFAVLNVPDFGTWCCLFHDDNKASMSVYKNADGVCCWKCHGCGRGGTIVDALALKDGISPAEAIRALVARFGGEGTQNTTPLRPPTPRAKETPQEPVPPTPENPDDLQRFVDTCALSLQQDTEAQDLFMRKKRGLSLQTCETHTIGFCRRYVFPDWSNRTLRDFWTLPVYNPDGQLCACKLHLEDPPEGQSKGLWMPCGTRGSDGRRRNGYACLFPCIETGVFSEREAIMEIDGGLLPDAAHKAAGKDCPPVYLCEGELKAAACLSAGCDALSPTDGAGHKWTETDKARLAGRRIVVLYDDDEQGRKFRDNSIQNLSHIALEIRVGTFGRKKHDNGKS